MKKIILTGGGTAGHITPNLALLPRLRKAGFDIHYIGLRGGMEEKLIKPEGVPFYGITGGKLRRYFDMKNFTDIFKIGGGFFGAVSIIKKVKPDVIFSKGGFVSTPVVWAGAACGVPVVAHESDMTVGLANKLSMPFARKICYTFPETAKYVPDGKGVLTGLPIRESVLSGSPAKGRAVCGFPENGPVLLVTGGSQGSAFINSMVRNCLGSLLKKYLVCHICGKGNVDDSLKRPGYAQFDYVNDGLADLFAAADIVVSRGGATSIFELLALCKPNIIVPYSKKASRGDQILNGRSFRKQGFSEMLEEEDATKEKFLKLIDDVYANREFYIKNMKKSGMADGLDNVMEAILDAAGR